MLDCRSIQADGVIDMSNRSALLAALLLVAALPASAQQGAELNDARAILSAERSDIIREEIYLTEQEASAFWPVYESYVADLEKVREPYAAMISDYVRAYNDAAVTPEFAERLVDRHLAFRKDVLAIQKRFLPKFRKALPPLKAARFYQLENKIDAEIQAELALLIPLIDPV